MATNKLVRKSVTEMKEIISNKQSSQFSENDYHQLVHAVLTDREFKLKRFVIKGTEILESEDNVTDAMDIFLGKFLKHVGISEPEASQIIKTFEYSPKDIKFMVDVIDEAMHQYLEQGKSLKLFKQKELELTLKKIQRTGKYEGQITFKKKVDDKKRKVQKKKEALAKAEAK